MTLDVMVKYVWRTGDASPRSNKKRIFEIDWFLTEKSLISGPMILLIIWKWKNSNAVATFEMSLNHQDLGVWRSGRHPWILQLKSFILSPFSGFLLIYCRNRTIITLTDITIVQFFEFNFQLGSYYLLSISLRCILNQFLDSKNANDHLKNS